MKLKLFLLLTMLVSASALWAQTGVQGTVIDAKSGLPVVGATVMLDNQGNTVTTGPSGATGKRCAARDWLWLQGL